MEVIICKITVFFLFVFFVMDNVDALSMERTVKGLVDTLSLESTVGGLV